MGYIYIYGAGKTLYDLKDKIPWGEIECILDVSEQKINTEFMGVKIVHPDLIEYTGADIIVVSSRKFYWDIYEELTIKYNLKSRQIMGILSWLKQKCLAVDFSMYVSDYRAIEDVFYVLSFIGVENVLSYTDIFSLYGVISKNDIRLKRWMVNKHKKIDCMLSSNCIFPYEKVAVKIDDDRYDAIVCMDAWNRLSWYDQEQLLKYNTNRYLIISIPYNINSEMAIYIHRFKRYGQVNVVLGFSAGWIFIIDHQFDFKSDFKMYMVTHKKLNIRLNLKQRNIIPLFAGAVGKDSYGYLGDDTGDNISKLNPWINECTALYWLWKNENSNYVGLCHYRRMFLCKKMAEYKRENLLWPSEARKYLQYYDIIVAEIADNYEENGVLNTLSYKVQADAVDLGIKIVRSLISERQPDYVEAFDKVIHGVAIFPCNMFITRREILNEYCTWLFSFIIDAAKSIDISLYDDYSKRIIGFIAERMLTVWLLKNELKIKELPIILFGKDIYE